MNPIGSPHNFLGKPTFAPNYFNGPYFTWTCAGAAGCERTRFDDGKHLLRAQTGLECRVSVHSCTFREAGLSWHHKSMMVVNEPTPFAAHKPPTQGKKAQHALKARSPRNSSFNSATARVASNKHAVHRILNYKHQTGESYLLSRADSGRNPSIKIIGTVITIVMNIKIIILAVLVLMEAPCPSQYS